MRSLLKVIGYDLRLEGNTDILKALSILDFPFVLLRAISLSHFWDNRLKVSYL